MENNNQKIFTIKERIKETKIETLQEISKTTLVMATFIGMHLCAPYIDNIENESLREIFEILFKDGRPLFMGAGAFGAELGVICQKIFSNKQLKRELREVLESNYEEKKGINR